MVSDSKRLKFPFIAGSSLPVTWRLPSVDMPLGADLRESVCVCYGGVDSYDFHGYETAQCMSERRKGGEVGIRSVHALKGDALWTALEAPERQVTQRLFVSGLNRSHGQRDTKLGISIEEGGDGVKAFHRVTREDVRIAHTQGLDDASAYGLLE